MNNFSAKRIVQLRKKKYEGSLKVVSGEGHILFVSQKRFEITNNILHK